MESVILIVDDEPQVLNSLRRLIQRKTEFAVVTAGSGAEALEILREQKPAVIISDMRMPQMDGLTFLAKSLELSPASIRIVLSAFADISLVIAAVNSGQIWQYLTKPWDEPQLITILSNAVDLFLSREKEHHFHRQVERLNLKLQSILSSVHDGVAVTDSHGSVIITNHSFIEFCGSDMKGCLLEDLLLGFGVTEPVTTLRSAGRFVGQLGNRSFEFSIAQYEQCPLAGGSLVLIVRDVTKEKEVAAIKDRFVASVSHELRTPLSSIIGFSKMMKNNAKLTEDQRQEFLEIIHEEGVRLSSLVENILTISTFESGTIQYHLQKTSLNSVIKECVKLLAGESQRSGIELTAVLPSSQIFALADGNALRQVLINLIGNGCKFNHPDGTVSVHLAHTQEHAVITVEDSGIGIPRSEQGKVFDLFYRVHHQRKGTGIGLSVVQEIIAAHNGKIEIDSVEGEGTRIRIFLKHYTESDDFQI